MNDQTQSQSDSSLDHVVIAQASREVSGKSARSGSRIPPNDSTQICANIKRFSCAVNVDYTRNVSFETMCELTRVTTAIIETCGETLANGEVKAAKLSPNVYRNYTKNNGG